MIDVGQFGELLTQQGFNFFTGVPCSFLKSLINFAINEREYVAATNEGEAVAIAAGAQVGGKRSCVLLQNSGLTNALAPLTSLNHIFEIPVLGLVSLRGEPGLEDEPQHRLVGKITAQLLKLCEIETFVMESSIDAVRSQLQAAEKIWRENRSVFFIVRKGTFGEEKLKRQLPFVAYERVCSVSSIAEAQPTREDTLRVINQLKDRHTLLVATTGKTGRELFEVENSPQHFYMVGSMGCVSSFGLGLALSRPENKIIAVDGDGSLLMRMGSLATNAYYRPKNFLHILLNNGTHDSTGGQDTVSPNLSFTRIASHAGYPFSYKVHGLSEFSRAVEHWKRSGGLTFVELPIAKGSKSGLGRPTVSPVEVKDRFSELLS